MKSISVLSMFALMAISLHAQVIAPISVTLAGTDSGDVIYGPVPGDTTANIHIDGGNNPSSGAFHLAEQGFFAGDPTYGLPASGTIVSQSDSNASFQLQGANATNLIKYDGAITLTSPAAYSNLDFLVASADNPGTAPATFTLNFASGPSTTLTTTGIVPFIFYDQPATTGGSVAWSGGALVEGVGENGTPVSLYGYDFALSSADSSRVLDSITVSGNGGALLTFAVSGTVSDVPEPSTYAMLLGALALLVAAVRLRRSPAGLV